MKAKTDFVGLVLLAVEKEALRKLIFSRPHSSEVQKITCRLVAHRGRRLLAMEYSLPGNTVSQKNVPEDKISDELSILLSEYRQANLLTSAGDAERKVSKKGDEVILGGDSLMRRLCGDAPDFEKAIEALDRKKNYILSGDEIFLKKLGISSENGRIHDKRQGKFRQINKFLEHLEDVYPKLPTDGELVIFDLCCGKSYLSFAVYYYLTEIKGRKVSLFGADLKRDVIIWCDGLARQLGYSGMRFEVADISTLSYECTPDMVISLHACDVATDIVLETAVRLGAKVILSTPCCHRYLKDRIKAESLQFVSSLPHVSGKLCEVLTDGLRVLRLKAAGYSVTTMELTDPENTPKNTLIRAVKNPRMSEKDFLDAEAEYKAALSFLLGGGAEDYLKGITR